MYLFEYSDLVNEGGELPGTVITGSSNLSQFQIPTKSTLCTVENLGAAFKDLIKTYAQLAKDQGYLNRIIATSNSDDDGDEVLILTEEFSS